MNYNRTVFQSLTLISQFAIHMLVPIFLCCAIGYWLDEKFQTSCWFIIFFFLGALAGGRNVFHLAKKTYDSDDTKPSLLYGTNGKKKKEQKGENR